MSAHHPSGRPAAAALATVCLALALTGCGPKASSSASGHAPGASAPAEEPAPDAGPTQKPGTEAGTEAGASFPGTGAYRIGTDIPYGGYQLHGQPDAIPAGCTWSILDTDGVAVGENNGLYAFLTDVPEYVTFQTEGCPDWERFE